MFRVKIGFVKLVVKTDEKIRGRKFELPILSIRYINFFWAAGFVTVSRVAKLAACV
jgi:hypothetical protein